MNRATAKHLQIIHSAIYDPALKVSINAAHEIVDSLHPGPVAFYLRAYPEYAEKLSKMSPRKVRKEIRAIATAFDKVSSMIADSLSEY